jgi:hypothetical protein
VMIKLSLLAVISLPERAIWKFSLLFYPLSWVDG